MPMFSREKSPDTESRYMSLSESNKKTIADLGKILNEVRTQGLNEMMDRQQARRKRSNR